MLLMKYDVFCRIPEKCGTFTGVSLSPGSLLCNRPSYVTEETTLESAHFIVHFTLGKGDPHLNGEETSIDLTTLVYAQKVSQFADYTWYYECNILGWSQPPEGVGAVPLFY